MAGGLNLYGYASQSPLDSVDPWGLTDSEEHMSPPSSPTKESDAWARKNCKPSYWMDADKRNMKKRWEPYTFIPLGASGISLFGGAGANQEAKRLAAGGAASPFVIKVLAAAGKGFACLGAGALGWSVGVFIYFYGEQEPEAIICKEDAQLLEKYLLPERVETTVKQTPLYFHKGETVYVQTTTRRYYRFVAHHGDGDCVLTWKSTESKTLTFTASFAHPSVHNLE